METNSDDAAPPQPNDLAAWRAAISDGRLPSIRPEDIVGAIQDLGPNTEKAILNALAKHLSDLMLHLLRARVGRHHPNQGLDIIERVHSQLWEAILRPDSSDGKGLRTAFYARLNFRLKDAIVAEDRAHRPSDEAMADGQVAPGTSAQLTAEPFDPPDPTDIAELDWKLDVDLALEVINDPQKRLAFRLFMDGLPYKSTRSRSIAEALGINEKKARERVAEAQELLKQT